ncbi:hypothetical protein CR513_17453, partial [Mucuna pruriens]
MIKNEMKMIRFMIMIMIILGFAQADYAHVQVESNTDSSKIICRIKCAFKCESYLPFPPLYSKCIDDCYAQCNKMSIGAYYDCITGCALIKSINVNIGIRSFLGRVVDSCLQRTMTKNAMKTTGGMIIIITMLSFTRVSSNTPIVQDEPNIESDGLICAFKCAISCAHFANSPIIYTACVTLCNATCSKKSIDIVYNCITRCGLNKSTDINIVLRHLQWILAYKNVRTSHNLLQECSRKKMLSEIIFMHNYNK